MCSSLLTIENENALKMSYFQEMQHHQPIEAIQQLGCIGQS